MIIVDQLNKDLMRLGTELLNECDALKEAARKYAEKENAYRMAKAQAFIKSEGKTVDAKKADVDIICERARLDAHIAEGLLDATKERVRSLRAYLSALQSIAASHRSEAEFTRTGTY